MIKNKLINMLNFDFYVLKNKGDVYNLIEKITSGNYTNITIYSDQTKIIPLPNKSSDVVGVYGPLIEVLLFYVSTSKNEEIKISLN